MALNLEAIGKKIKAMDLEHCIIQMEMFTKANGHKTKPTEKVNMFIPMVLYILENGRMTNSMDLEYNNGLMEESIKANIKMA